MKSLFPGYYRPTDAEFESLWKSAIFAIDANVLLNMYGYTPRTREQLIELLEGLAPRLRMPHQFALEYQRNRAKAIMEQVKNYARVEKALADIDEKELAPKLRHPFLSIEMMSAFKRVRKELAASRKQHEILLTNDPYHARISNMLAGRIGQAPNDTAKANLYQVAKARYAVNTPPGYADLKEKGEPDAFGDCIGWLQIIEIGRAEKKPTIFITEDAKLDWWQIQGDRTIGPRPELIAEYVGETGCQFHMYSSAQFMNFARTYLKKTVEKGAISELVELTRARLSETTAKQERPVVHGKPVPAGVLQDSPKSTPTKPETFLSPELKDNPKSTPADTTAPLPFDTPSEQPRDTKN